MLAITHRNVISSRNTAISGDGKTQQNGKGGARLKATKRQGKRAKSGSRVRTTTEAWNCGKPQLFSRKRATVSIERAFCSAKIDAALWRTWAVVRRLSTSNNLTRPESARTAPAGGSRRGAH